MNAKWLYTSDSGNVDERGEPVQYEFRYTVGSLITRMDMATNKYWWKGDREAEASGIMLEPVMPIEHEEAFHNSEYEAWAETCQFWANSN